jgi:predicted nucleotide-binding protein (sugar kinase/HSP70/actin superfamily)
VKREVYELIKLCKYECFNDVVVLNFIDIMVEWYNSLWWFMLNKMPENWVMGGQNVRMETS